jgi:hypothetical protein
VLELVSAEAATEVRLSAEVSSAKTASAAHSTTKVRSAAHSATVPALGQRTCCHRGRAKRDRRRNNECYLTHERSSFWRCCNLQDDAGALAAKLKPKGARPMVVRIFCARVEQ